MGRRAEQPHLGNAAAVHIFGISLAVSSSLPPLQGEQARGGEAVSSSPTTRDGPDASIRTLKRAGVRGNDSIAFLRASRCASMPAGEERNNKRDDQLTIWRSPLGGERTCFTLAQTKRADKGERGRKVLESIRQKRSLSAQHVRTLTAGHWQEGVVCASEKGIGAERSSPRERDALSESASGCFSDASAASDAGHRGCCSPTAAANGPVGSKGASLAAAGAPGVTTGCVPPAVVAMDVSLHSAQCRCTLAAGGASFPRAVNEVTTTDKAGQRQPVSTHAAEAIIRASTV